jgi:hypothetical protein
LSSIREQVHDDGTTRDGLVNIEQVLALDPAILLSLIPRRTVLSDANDDIETVVAQVQTLTMALRAVTDQSQCIILEVFLRRVSSEPV